MLVPHLILRSNKEKYESAEFGDFIQYCADAISSHRSDTNWREDLETLDEKILRSVDSRFGVSPYMI